MSQLDDKDGQAPRTWLLLRGLGREQAHWFDFPEQVERALGVRVVCLDLPGTGTEWQRPAPGLVADNARDVAGRLRHEFGVPSPPWGILGLSFGAMVGLSLGELFPEWFSHIVTLNVSTSLSMPQQRLRPRAVISLARIAAHRDAFEREKDVFRLSTSLPERRVLEYAKLGAEIYAQRPVTRRTVFLQLAAAAVFRPRGPLPQRVLVLSSENDALVLSTASVDLARFIRAPHICHPTSGHDIAVDDPNWVLHRIARWLELTHSQRPETWRP